MWLIWTFGKCTVFLNLILKLNNPRQEKQRDNTNRRHLETSIFQDFKLDKEKIEIKSPLGNLFCLHIDRKRKEKKRQGTQQTFSCSWSEAYFVHGKGISASQNRFLTGSFSKKCWKRTFFSVKSTCFFGPIQLIMAGSPKTCKTI